MNSDGGKRFSQSIPQIMKTTAPVYRNHTDVQPRYESLIRPGDIRLCEPAPAAIIIHIDLSDGSLEAELKKRFPDAAILTSSARRGPGGERHRCLLACKTPFAVSFDDDSYPIDSNFFATLERLFLEHPRTALLEANIWHRNEPELPRATSLTPITWDVDTPSAWMSIAKCGAI